MTAPKPTRTKKVTDNTPANEFTAPQVCALLGVSNVTLTEYIEKKGLPVLRGGGKGVPRVFDAHQVFLWIKSGGKSDNTDSESGAAQLLKIEQERYKLMLLQEKLKSVQMANETLLGKLYPADIVDSTWAEMIANCTKTINALAPRIEFNLRSVTDTYERVDVIKSSLDDLRIAMSSMSYNFDMEFYEELLEKNSDEPASENEISTAS